MVAVALEIPIWNALEREEMRRIESKTLHRVDQLIPSQHILLTSITELKDQYFTTFSPSVEIF